MYAAGLMSGTSCDGLSGALIRQASPTGRPSLLATAHVPYRPADRRLLLDLASGEPAGASAVACG